MKILVCGSGDWINDEVIFLTLSDLEPKDEIDIIHGAAPGADTIAAEFAVSLEFRSVTPFPAKWREYGYYDPFAGKRRNLQMLDEKPDLVIAFWDGFSRGTKHTIENAHERGIPVQIIEQPDWRSK